MPPTSTSPFEMLKRISPNLVQQDRFPLLGYPPEFPWREFEHKLSKQLELKNLHFSTLSPQWLDAQHIAQGFSSELLIIQVMSAALASPLYVLFSQEDLRLLMRNTLGKQQTNFEVIDPDFFNGFVYFLGFEILKTIHTLPFDDKLDFQFEVISSLPTTDALTIDIQAEAEGQTLLTRLVMPPEFGHSWRTRYAKNSGQQSNSAIALNTTLHAHLQIGKVRLKKRLWEKVKKGDLLLLDSCSFDPWSHKEQLILTVEEVPLFQLQHENSQLKIIDFATLSEVEENMPNNDFEDEDTDFEDFDFDEDEDFADADQKLDQDEDDFDFEEEEEELDVSEDVNEAKQNLTSAPLNVTTPVASKSLSLAPSSDPLQKIEHIPLSLSIELGKIEMPLQKLVQLQPGNLIELNIRPEDGVDIVLNQRKIAKGELLKIGEVLGVRILDIH